MFLTKDEAREKWCFLTIGQNDLPYRTCVASACMAWRWRPLIDDDLYAEAVKKVAAEINDTPFEGYCGLALKPGGAVQMTRAEIIHTIASAAAVLLWVAAWVIVAGMGA